MRKSVDLILRSHLQSGTVGTLPAPNAETPIDV